VFALEPQELKDAWAEAERAAGTALTSKDADESSSKKAAVKVADLLRKWKKQEARDESIAKNKEDARQRNSRPNSRTEVVNLTGDTESEESDDEPRKRRNTHRRTTQLASSDDDDALQSHGKRGKSPADDDDALAAGSRGKQAKKAEGDG